MIDIEHEQMVGLSAAAKRLPPSRGGRPVHPSCLLRWIIDGVKTRQGNIVRLEAVRLGGRWLTSFEALARFAEAQTPKPEGSTSMPRPPASRQRAFDRAQRRLREVGI